MKTIVSFFLSIILVTQFSCGYHNQAKDKEMVVTPAPADTVNKTEEKRFANIHFASKYDTSCGMPLSAGIGDTLHLNDKIYGFCSKDCKDEFAAKLKAEKKRQ